MIVMKQVYEPAVESDGYRVLTERLWPRGVSTGQGRARCLGEADRTLR